MFPTQHLSDKKVGKMCRIPSSLDQNQKQSSQTLANKDADMGELESR